MKMKIVLLMLVAMMATASADVVVREIQDENDDGEEYLNNYYGSPGYSLGDGYLISSDLEMGSEFNPLMWSMVGLQYDGLGIPQGATINSAKLTFTVDEDIDAGTSNDFTIFGELAGDASLFNHIGSNYNQIVPFDITGRARTSASAAWSPTDPAVGLTIDTPDLAGIIQAIVDQGGWSDNNRLTLLLFPDAYLDGAPLTTGVTGHTYEGGPGSDSATLTVDFTVPEPATMCLLGLGGLMLRRRKRA